MRVLVVSHACVIPVNQEVYLELSRRGHDVTLVVPNRWDHAYSPKTFAPRAHEGFRGRVHPLPVVLPGRPQRHAYRAGITRLLAEEAPDLVVIEEEAFSVAGSQWALAARRAGIPYGMQIAENLPHRIPGWAKPLCRLNLGRAGFVFARSPAAGELATRLGSRVTPDVWPHVVPSWPAETEAVDQATSAQRTIGFAGRLVPDKGIDLLLAAHRALPDDITLVVAGDGPLRSAVEQRAAEGARIELCTPAHADMPDFYRRIDVLLLPSRTTPTWSEQFGRVLVEAMWFGVPVVASASGEIPWVMQSTGGGVLVPEGNVDELVVATLKMLDDAPARWAAVKRGRANAHKYFSATGGAETLERIGERVLGR